MKELPKMYHNNIDKDIVNNEKVFSTMYSDTRSKDRVKVETNSEKNYTVEQKNL